MNKIAIYSDPHHGLSVNDPTFHAISLEFYQWFLGVCEEHGVSEIWCAGDVFHNRKEINLPTLRNAYECLDVLTQYPMKIVVGNHDAFYLENSVVHSLDIFKNWPNITIIDHEKDFIYGDRKVKFIPWVGEEYTVEVGECDVAVVHMELVGFEMNQTTALHGTSPSIFKKCPLVISGHFHKHQDRQFKDTRIYYVGSPFQHNWGELDEKYVHILDLDSMELTKVVNNVSPKHIFIDNASQLKPDVCGNFVRIHIDSEEAEECYQKYFEKHRPLNVSFVREVKAETQNAIITDFKNVAIPEMTVEFIMALNESADVKQDVLKLHNMLYEKTVAD